MISTNAVGGRKDHIAIITATLEIASADQLTRILNKIDRLPEDEVDAHCQAIVDELGWDGPVFKISALRGEGVKDLMFAIMNFLERRQEEESGEQE